MCVDRGLEPIVTLHHFTHPFWLGEEFWLRPGSPDIFARHVARILPSLAPYCRRWVTINEPNIVTLMGWIEGSCPPGRRMAVADAFCALDNILTAHVLAADVVTGVQPEAEVTVNTSSSSIYEHDRMLLDLLQVREAGVDPDDVDRYVDERRTVHDAAFPPRHAGEAVIRRFFASVSPYGAVREPGRGAAWAPAARCDAPQRPARVLDAVYASPRPRAHGCGRLRLVRPGGQPRHACPGPAHAVGRAGLVVQPGLLGRGVAPGGACAPGASRSRRCGRASRCGSWRTAWRRGRSTGRPSRARTAWTGRATCASTWARWSTPWPSGAPVTAYFHWSLMDNYEWGTYEPRYGLFGVDRSDPAAVRFMDTDAVGDDAAGEFTRVVAGLRAGDRSVLGGPG